MANLPADGKQPSTQELLRAEAHVWNIAFSFMNSMCLKCAFELAIPDIIHKHGKPMKLCELTKALNINESKSLCINHLMRVLVHAKFFTKVNISGEEGEDDEDNKGFMLTPAYRPFLIKDDEFSMVSFTPVVFSHDILIDPSHNMSQWFQNDDPTPFWTCHGRAFWDHLKLNPGLNQFFSEGMASDTELVSRIVPKDCKEVFEGLELMVDVGGSTGYMAKVISHEFPHLKCIVLDLPQVVDGLKGNDKLTFIGGDMFQSIPLCDAVFLKWILHNWSDEDCLKILKKCKEAVYPSKDKGGKVIVIDIVVGDQEDHKAVETQLFYDMMMMTAYNGKERTLKEWAILFFEAGFTSYKITPLLGIGSLIEVFP